MADIWQRIAAGEPFLVTDSELRQQKQHMRQRVAQFNRAPSKGNMARVFSEFKAVGEGCFIEPGLHVDIGVNIALGHRVYINANCVILDAADVVIGDDVLIGPGAQLIAVSHPLDAEERTAGYMWSMPIEIGAQAWIGAGAIILPGLSIGARAVIGAGSVVTKDVPEGSVVTGNPARATTNSD